MKRVKRALAAGFVSILSTISCTYPEQNTQDNIEAVRQPIQSGTITLLEGESTSVELPIGPPGGNAYLDDDEIGICVIHELRSDSPNWQMVDIGVDATSGKYVLYAELATGAATDYLKVTWACANLYDLGYGDPTSAVSVHHTKSLDMVYDHYFSMQNLYDSGSGDYYSCYWSGYSGIFGSLDSDISMIENRIAVEYAPSYDQWIMNIMAGSRIESAITGSAWCIGSYEGPFNPIFNPYYEASSASPQWLPYTEESHFCSLSGTYVFNNHSSVLGTTFAAGEVGIAVPPPPLSGEPTWFSDAYPILNCQAIPSP